MRPRGLLRVPSDQAAPRTEAAAALQGAAGRSFGAAPNPSCSAVRGGTKVAALLAAAGWVNAGPGQEVHHPEGSATATAWQGGLPVRLHREVPGRIALQQAD